MPDFLINDNGKQFKVTAPDYGKAMDAYRAHKTSRDMQGAAAPPRQMYAPPNAQQTYDRQPPQAQQPAGDDPLVYRGSVLPLGKTQGGKVVPAMPAPLYDAAGVTKRMMEGGPAPTGQETFEMGTMGTPGPVARGGSGVLKPSGPRRFGTGRGEGEIYETQRPKPPAPSSAEFKQSKINAYNDADQAGVTISPQGFSGLVQGIGAELAKDTTAFHPKLQPQGQALMDVFNEEAAKGQAISLTRLDTLRKLARGVLDSSADKNQKRIAEIFIDKIDDFIDNLGPHNVLAGNGEKGAAALKSARAFALQERKSEILDDVFKQVELKSGEYKQSGRENALRDRFKALANNKKLIGKFNPEEQQAIRDVATTGGVQAFMIGAGAFSPTSGVFGKAAALFSGEEAIRFNPLYALIPMAGFAAKTIATNMRETAARKVGELVRGGKPASDYQFQQQLKKRARAGQIERLGLFGGAGLAPQTQQAPEEFNPLIHPNQL